jgi:hypothetical protein
LCRRPADPSMSLACRSPNICDATIACCVDQSISTWKKSNPSLYKHGRGHQEPPPPTNNPASANVYMVKGDAFISTRAHDYSKPSTSEKGKEYELPSLPLQIEKMLGETMTCIPKGTFKNNSHNPNARATQNYSVVEYLSQTPCAISALEVLQSCPSQRKVLLTALGSIETFNIGTIMLDTTNLKPRLPYHVAFQIVVAYPMKNFTRNIFCMVVDEGALTCVMSLEC